MYLAKIRQNHATRYLIRQSYAEDGCMKSRDVADLGTDPARHIVYVGGKGYYYTDAVQDALAEAGLSVDQEELDRIFFDFLDPEIRRVITGFDRSRRRSVKTALGENAESPGVPHLFDRRRYHFLRFGASQQRGIDRVPEKVFLPLYAKSRDELEQYFMKEEGILRHREKPVYVTTVFDLGRFRFSARSELPVQEQLDAFFTTQLCRLDEDAGFWAGTPSSKRLRDYLVRYAVMYFDYDPPQRSPWQAAMEDFVNRHRAYRPPKKVRVKLEEAGRLFGMPWEELKKLDRTSLVRLYRQLARRHHPDLGGEADSFRQLTETYKLLLKRRR